MIRGTRIKLVMLRGNRLLEESLLPKAPILYSQRDIERSLGRAFLEYCNRSFRRSWRPEYGA